MQSLGVDAPVYRAHLAGALEIYPGTVNISTLDLASRRSVVVTSGFVGVSEAEMRMLPELGLVCCIGTGHENVDLEAARALGIRVTHAAGANAATVADHALALLSSLVRDISRPRPLWLASLSPSGRRPNSPESLASAA